MKFLLRIVSIIAYLFIGIKLIFFPLNISRFDVITAGIITILSAIADITDVIISFLKKQGKE